MMTVRRWLIGESPVAIGVQMTVLAVLTVCVQVCFLILVFALRVDL